MDRIMDTDLNANLVFKLEQRVKEEWFILCGLIITSTCSCKHQKAKYATRFLFAMQSGKQNIKGRNIFSYLTLSRMLPCVFGGS